MSTRALLLLLPGLGDALSSGPIISAATHSPDWQLDTLVMIEPVAEYARALKLFGEVIVLDLLERQAQSLPALLALRKRRYDFCILPFPATRWQYHAAALLVGAVRLVTHDYGGIAKVLDRTAGAQLVPLQGGHRIFENVRLAQALGFATNSSEPHLIPAGWRRRQIPGLLGVHTGSMRYKGNEAKRWALSRFIDVIQHYTMAGRRVRVFIGPAEREDAEPLQTAATAASVELVQAGLSEAAQKLSECEVFLGNDSGIANIAAALGVSSVVLFGMTDPKRLQPLGPALALRPSACPACHDEGSRNFACVRRIGYRCIREDMPVAAVIAAVDRAFASALRPALISKTGAFRLYARSRATTQT